MKILHVADLHLRETWFAWLIRESAAYDLLVIAGDLLDMFAPVPYRAQTRAAIDWLAQLQTPTVVCSGNHDVWECDIPTGSRADPDANWLRDLRGKGSIVGTDGAVLDHDGVTIAVNGWRMVPTPSPRVDVLVTHAPPSGCAAAGAPGGDFGDPALYGTVRTFAPAWLLSGHVHHPRQHACRWPSADSPTTVLVPGCFFGDEAPAHWIVDVSAEECRHVRLAR